MSEVPITRDDNGYQVHLEATDNGWKVEIRDAPGVTVAERRCRDEAEARTYASTVRQHIYWLSGPKFRSYYGLK